MSALKSLSHMLGPELGGAAYREVPEASQAALSLEYFREDLEAMEALEAWFISGTFRGDQFLLERLAYLKRRAEERAADRLADNPDDRGDV